MGSLLGCLRTVILPLRELGLTAGISSFFKLERWNLFIVTLAVAQLQNQAQRVSDFSFSLQAASLSSNLGQQLKTEKSRNCDLMENFKRTRRLVEELQGEKEKMEQHLYGLFLPILHSKQVGSGVVA